MFDVQSTLSRTNISMKTDTLVKQTPRVSPCLTLLPLFDYLTLSAGSKDSVRPGEI